MKKSILVFSILFAATALAFAQVPEGMKEGNIWTTEDGGKYFTCPVMKGEARVENAEGVSVIDGVAYYHCCPSCQAPFRSDPQKWLDALFLPGNVIRIDEHGHKVFRDPVDGTEATVEKNTPVLDEAGKRIFFTSKKTKEQYLKRNG